LPETGLGLEKICGNKFWQVIMPNKTSRSENGSIGTSLALDERGLFGFLSWWCGWRILLLPHEYAFSLFLAITSGRLVAGVGLTSPLSLAFLGFLLASALVDHVVRT
jgi:hypothetical protein